MRLNNSVTEHMMHCYGTYNSVFIKTTGLKLIFSLKNTQGYGSKVINDYLWWCQCNDRG